MAETYVVLDTNLFQHFQRPDLIDWLRFLKRDWVTLLVTPALIDELEHQKADTRRSAKTRERAHKAIMYLGGYIDHLEPVEIRPNVRLFFLRESPSINFEQYKLSHLVPDDQLIASAIQHKTETGAEVIFVTNDMGLRLKLPTRGLSAVAPRPEDALPEELDESQLEISKLKSELDRLKNRLPRPRLHFAKGASPRRFKLRDAKDVTLPRLDVGSYGESYKHRFAEYQADFKEWIAKVALMIDCQLRIVNEGTAAVTKLQIELAAPEIIKFVDGSPEKPKRPQSGYSLFEGISMPVMPHIYRETDPWISRNGSSAGWTISSLLHNGGLTLVNIILKFRDLKDAQNFNVRYTLKCAELIDPIVGTIDFVYDPQVEEDNETEGTDEIEEESDN